MPILMVCFLFSNISVLLLWGRYLNLETTRCWEAEIRYDFSPLAPTPGGQPHLSYLLWLLSGIEVSETLSTHYQTDLHTLLFSQLTPKSSCFAQILAYSPVRIMTHQNYFSLVENGTVASSRKLVKKDRLAFTAQSLPCEVISLLHPLQLCIVCYQHRLTEMLVWASSAADPQTSI